MTATKEFEFATWAIIFILFTNMSAIAKQHYGVPGVIAGSFALLLLLPFGYYVLIRQEKLIFDYVLGLMFVFMAICMISSLFAKDLMVAFTWVGEFFVEGIVLYFLMINVIRSLDTLKRVIWVLMIAGSLLGGMSLYQEASGDYEQQFGGLGQRNVAEDWRGDPNLKQGTVLKERTKVRTSNRASGPIGDANRYAQNMLQLLPLAIFMLWQIRFPRWAKATAAVAVGLIFSAILLTYSRGAFVSILVLAFILTAMKYIKIRQALSGLLIILLLIAIVSPGYFVRMQTIFGVEGLVSETSEHKPDAVTRGRLTEMMAAGKAFLDHPLLGVGPHHYSKYYSIEYMNDPTIALRTLTTTRRAHSLYPELAAETGIFGFAVFMGIIFYILYRLLQERRRWLISRPDLAHLATAFVFSMVGYLCTAIFLHFSYQRYFWLFLALAGACVQILNSTNTSQAISAVNLRSSVPPTRYKNPA
jgi:putative inorganic carbon (HCO3(-)) transporter